MKVTKICQYCGKEYQVSQSQYNRSKFCSDKCFRNNKNTQVVYMCDYCGKEFLIQKSKVDKRLSGKSKYLCCSTECAKEIQKPKWEDIEQLFEERGYILLSKQYINAKTKLEYICPNHQEFGVQYITYNNLKQGYGCKYCGTERMADSRRLSFDEAKAIFEQHDMILLEQDYKNTHIPLKYICKHHEEFGIQYMSLSNAYKQHCPHCNKNKGEDKISRYLLENNIQFTPQKSYDDLRGVGGGKLSYDFYLPNFNLLIEYQGEQHEHPVEAFGGIEQFKIQQEHDKRKKDYARTCGIELLELWYYDFANIEQILNSKILLIA